MELNKLKTSNVTDAFLEIEIMLHKIDQKAQSLVKNEWKDDYNDTFTELLSIIDSQLQISIHDDISKMEVC